MSQNETINYIEFPSKNLATTKSFFSSVFGWNFVDYGPDYSAFTSEVIKGGFFKSPLTATTERGSALIVFHSEDLEKTRLKILNAGGSIIKPIFSFPGGRRFHFGDPNGNEYAVWSSNNG